MGNFQGRGLSADQILIRAQFFARLAAENLAQAEKEMARALKVGAELTNAFAAVGDLPGVR